MRYAQVMYDDINNGKGLRISFWVQGCTHRCVGCHNSELWEFNKGKEFTTDIVRDIISHFRMYNEYYDGLSILGGEPFDNLDVIEILIKEFRANIPNKDIWIWSGYTFEEIVKDINKLEILKICDILIDGKYNENQRNVNLQYRGSENQRVVDIKESLLLQKIILKEENK